LENPSIVLVLDPLDKYELSERKQAVEFIRKGYQSTTGSLILNPTSLKEHLFTKSISIKPPKVCNILID